MFHTSLKPVKDYPCEGENKKKGKFFYLDLPSYIVITSIISSNKYWFNRHDSCDHVVNTQKLYF